LTNEISIEQVHQPRKAINSYQVYGAASLRSSFHGNFLNTRLNYTLFPLQTFNSIQSSLDISLPWSIKLSGNISYDLLSKSFSVATSLYRDVSPFKTRISASWAQSSGFSIELSAFTNLSTDYKNSKMAFDSRSLATLGSISARVFLDTNHNSKWDNDEKPLQGVGFFVNSMSQDILTGPDGVAFIRGLTPHIVTNISISSSTLEDILMVPAIDGRSCVPRPGCTTTIDFPVWLTGEITGTIYMQNDGVMREAPGIQVYLINEEGNIVATTRSAYDGYYSFEKITSGSYTVRAKIDAKDTENFISRSVIIPPEGGYCDYIDLIYQDSIEQMPMIYE